MVGWCHRGSSTSSRPSFLRNFWSAKASFQLPLLAYASQKLLSAHVTSAAAEHNWSAWAHTYSFAQPAEQRNSRELVYTKVNMPASWYS
eukprot:1147949-Pelagomonas_calceolata.AAC.2